MKWVLIQLFVMVLPDKGPTVMTSKIDGNLKNEVACHELMESHKEDEAYARKKIARKFGAKADKRVRFVYACIPRDKLFLNDLSR